MEKIKLAILAAALAVASSASASLTVTIDGVSPDEIVTLDVTSTSTGFPTSDNYDGGVYAGIYNLTVNRVATPSFCIDVAHDVYLGEVFNDYSYATLGNSPASPAGPMNSTQEADIEKLWAAYYSDARASSLDAAALQVAIWETLGNGCQGYTVTASVYSGYPDVTSEVNTMLGSLPGLTTEADLIGLVSPDGQSYVVAVPEPSTMLAGALLLLPFGASTLRILRKRQVA
jgi:hypothetical protein